MSPYPAMNVILAGLLAVLFLSLGTAKILALAPMRELAAQVGFSTAAYRMIGGLEVAGAAGLLIGTTVPLIGGMAGAGLLLLLGGAVVTHVRNGDGMRKYAPALITGLLVSTYLVALCGAAL